MTSTWLIVLSLAVALGAPVAYALLLRVPVVRSHPEAYVMAFALATALAGRRRSSSIVTAWCGGSRSAAISRSGPIPPTCCGPSVRSRRARSPRWLTTIC